MAQRLSNRSSLRKVLIPSVAKNLIKLIQTRKKCLSRWQTHFDVLLGLAFSTLVIVLRSKDGSSLCMTIITEADGRSWSYTTFLQSSFLKSCIFLSSGITLLAKVLNPLRSISYLTSSDRFFAISTAAPFWPKITKLIKNSIFKKNLERIFKCRAVYKKQLKQDLVKFHEVYKCSVSQFHWPTSSCFEI